MDEDLGPIPRLNAQLYSADPGEYFRDRVKVLGLVAADADRLRAAFGEGFQWGPIRMVTIEDDTEEDNADSEARRRRLVLAESQALVHHAAEALIRLFTAHRGRPPCPWLELAALMPPEYRNARDELRAAASSPALLDDVSDVFLGHPVPDKERRTPGYDDALDSCRRVLRYAAATVWDGARSYNALKHGMAVVTGETMVQFVSDAGEASMTTQGASVEYIEVKNKTEMHHATRWLIPQRDAWLTLLIASLIDCLWDVARARYLAEPFEGLPVPQREAIDQLRDGFERPGPVEYFTIKVAEKRG